MSVLQIGQYSRQYQGSPGCRKNVSPFLTNEEKESIKRQKQRNQNSYRQILINQMKANLRQKQAQKKKQIKQDMKHEKLFYQKIKVYRQVDSRISGRKNIIRGSFTRSVDNEIPVFESNIFKKLTLPPLQSNSVNPSYKSHQKGKYEQSIFHSKYPQPQNSYLKYRSLMQIGSRLRDQGMTGSILLDDEIQDLKNQDFSRLGKKKFDKTYYKPEKKYKELKSQLKEKEIEIYQLLEKSSQMIQSTKSPLKQVKKRLNTQPVYIPEEFQDDDSQTILLRSRLKTQFQPYILDQQDEFYRLPLKSSISSIDQNSIHNMSMGQESRTLPSQRTDGMMRIEEENPQIESNDPNQQQNQQQYENDD